MGLTLEVIVEESKEDDLSLNKDIHLAISLLAQCPSCSMSAIII